MDKLLLIGIGGHFRSVLDSLDRTPFSEVALVDLPENVGEIRHGLRIVGSDADLPTLFAEGYRHGFVSLGSVGFPEARMRIFRELKQIGFALPCIIDPTAIVSEEATLGEGVFVGKGCIINTGVRIGACCIVNTGAIIDHDTVAGDFVHIAPGCCLAGSVTIGQGAHIGIGSSVLQGVEIGENSIIGAGSVVIRDIPADVVAVGTPCKPKREST